MLVGTLLEFLPDTFTYAKAKLWHSTTKWTAKTSQFDSQSFFALQLQIEAQIISNQPKDMLPIRTLPLHLKWICDTLPSKSAVYQSFSLINQDFLSKSITRASISFFHFRHWGDFLSCSGTEQPELHAVSCSAKSSRPQVTTSRPSGKHSYDPCQYLVSHLGKGTQGEEGGGGG